MLDCIIQSYNARTEMKVLCLENLEWIKLKTPNVEDDDYQFVPYMRYGHTASAIGDKVYIFGGRNDRNGACNNLFCFNTSECDITFLQYGIYNDFE